MKLNPSVPNLTLPLLSFFLFYGFSIPAYSQEIAGAPKYGTGNLENGFIPDPVIISMLVGGDLAPSRADGDCEGYLESSAPSYDLNYDSNSTTSLGIFVDSNIDTTLLVNTPDGEWHCNDDSIYLSDSNPGIYFESPQSGLYNIWVGSYSERNQPAPATLVLTEYETDSWSTLDIGSSSSLSRSISNQNQAIDFGNNSSQWSNDGECDDPRFEGDGMASTLVDEDLRADATDCESLFNSGSIRFIGRSSSQNFQSVDAASVNFQFGNNSSDYANDGECDDPRFEGDGMAVTLLDEDIAADATDCEQLFNSGSIRFIGQQTTGTANASLSGGINFGDNTSQWAFDDECDDPRFEGEQMASILQEVDLLHDADDCESLYNAGSIRLISDSAETGQRIEQGILEESDAQFDDGSYYDTYSFNGNAGEEWIIDLNATAFDTYLQVESPSGETFSNDDYNNSMDRSLVSLSLSESGTYQIRVNSFASDETGRYSLSIAQGIQSESDNRSYTGTLQSSDETFSDGEYFDTYSFSGQPGQRVSIELSSNEFDTYLILRDPNGETEANDDAGSTSQSRLEVDLSAYGTYEVTVTSFAAEETGDYELVISDIEGSIASISSAQELVDINIGESVNGELNSSDSSSDDAQFQDSYSFVADAGESLAISMRSSQVDTYLRLITPGGDSIENDDHDGDITQSRIEFTAAESGRYRVIATSYGASETGDYSLALSAERVSNTRGTLSRGSGSQIYGIFTGIADYPGSDSDLPLTDQDAHRARDALINGAGMNPGNATTLVNSDATLANFEAAFDRIASVAGPEDTLVIFYSGHGSRQERPTGPDSKDPDGMDETIVLYDQQLTDDRLAEMLEELDVGKVLLVMDSCFSGGFSKDVVSVPGRMGLFSSEEDVLSQVAMKFQAGGYLSVFFEEALTEPYADRDDNGELTAIELSQYLHDRFRADVKSFGTDEYVRASGPQANYQRLVVDRGGVGPYNVLFTRQ